MSLDTTGLRDGGDLYWEAFHSAFAFPADLTVSEWADNNRQLVTASSAEPGQWRTDRVPYMREIMDFLSEHAPGREGALMAASQVGKSECLLNAVGYTIDHSPCPMMYVMPTVQVAKRLSKQRVQPMIDATPALHAKVLPARSRDSGNTTESKEFPGGMLLISGANSASALKSAPIRRAMCDEIDEYPDDLDDQGSSLDLVRRRMSTFKRRKLLSVSTPTVKGASAIEALFESGTKERYHVPCPHCGVHQQLVIDNLMPNGAYACQHCGALAYEALHKTDMLAGGRWVAEHPERPVRSWQISGLYSPIGLGDTWVEIAIMRDEARSNPAKAKVFTNTVLGEAYEGESEHLEHSDLKKLREVGWYCRTIPRGCLLLTCAVDVQGNRFAIEIMGHGRGEQCWLIDYVEIDGDPKSDDWSALEAVVFASYQNQFGISLRPQLIGIDSGNWTNEVYRWVRRHSARGVIALKGSKERAAAALSRPAKVDVNAHGRKLHHGVRQWNVGVHAMKNTAFARLQADAAPDASYRYMHFPEDAPDMLFEQLASERLDQQANRWVKRDTHGRNEAWDCMVYNLALAQHPSIRIQNMREADWVALETKLEPEGDLFAGRALAPVAMATPATGLPVLASTKSAATKPVAPAATRPVQQIGSSDWFERGFS